MPVMRDLIDLSTVGIAEVDLPAPGAVADKDDAAGGQSGAACDGENYIIGKGLRFSSKPGAA